MRDCVLKGKAICKVTVGIRELIVITMIKVPAIYKPDWQKDCESWHDEGTYDYDIDKAEIVYPDEYTVVGLDETLIEGDKPITKLEEVLYYDIKE